MNVSLTRKLEMFVRTKVRGGRYNNASEVVREALRLMQDREEEQALKLARLRAAIAEGDAGLDAGRATELPDDRALKAFFERL